MKFRIGIILLALGLTPVIASAQSARERHSAADALEKTDKAKAIAMFEEIAGNTKFQADDRLRALQRLVEIHRAAKQQDEAVKAQQRRVELMSEPFAKRDLTYQLAEMQVQANQLPAAVKTLEDLAQANSDDAGTIASAHRFAAIYLQRAKDFAGAANHYDIAAKNFDLDDPARADALWELANCYAQAQQPDKSIEAARQIIDPRYLALPRWANRDAQELIARTFTQQKKFTELAKESGEWESAETSPSHQQRWCMYGARALRQAGDLPGAMKGFKRVFTQYCSEAASEVWYEAQQAIADILYESKEYPAALAASHLVLDMAPDPGQVGNAINRITDLLQKIDNNKTRAKNFIAYQLYGPAGKDGKPGTVDDATPVALPYPTDSEREAAFSKAMASVGDDAAASFHRAQMYMYIGQARPALDWYLDALKRSSFENWGDRAAVTVQCCWRTLRGNLTGIDSAAKYLLSGPAGEGQSSADPFAFEGEGSAIPPQSKEDAAVISSVGEKLSAMSSDLSISQQNRAHCVRALTRLVEAGFKIEDLTLFIKRAEEPDGSLRDAGVSLVLTVARKGEPHLGSMKSFIASTKFSQPVEKRISGELTRTTRTLERMTKQATNVPKVNPVN